MPPTLEAAGREPSGPPPQSPTFTGRPRAAPLQENKYFGFTGRRRAAPLQENNYFGSKVGGIERYLLPHVPFSLNEAIWMQLVACQIDIAWEDKPENQRRVRQLLENVDIEPGGLIVLPEMFDTGFSMNVAATAQGPERESECFLQELAAEHGAAVLGGVVTLQGDGRGANEAVAFAPDGRLLVRYRKMQPFSMSGEDRHYPAGDAPALFQWQGMTIAPFICYDLRFPELFRSAVDLGAELFTVIACWPAVRSEHWVRLLQARAIENLAFALGCNRCGSEPDLSFDGRSAAFDHLGRNLFEADAGPQVLTCHVDIDALRSWRDKFPALRDRRRNPSV